MHYTKFIDLREPSLYKKELLKIGNGKSKGHIRDDYIVFKRDGLFHRDDGPAVIYKQGAKYYYKNGEYHKEDGPAVMNTDSIQYYINGKLHREDGPAIMKSNGINYYINGKLHREDGPAIMKSNGDVQYYLNGVKYSDYDYNQIQFEKYKKDNKLQLKFK